MAQTASAEQGTDPNPPPTLTVEQTLDLLRKERRRLALSILSERGPVRLRDLADEVAKTTRPPGRDPRKHRKAIYVSLYQCHVPKLKQFGAVEDTPRGLALGPNADEVMDMKRRVEGVPPVRDALKRAVGQVTDSLNFRRASTLD